MIVHNPSCRRRSWLFWVAAACCVLSGQGFLALPFARAHQQVAPSTINRYAKLSLLSADRARLVYTMLIGATPALAVRTAADRDHNGQLDAAEQSLLCAQLAQQVLPALHFTVGDEPQALHAEPPSCALLVRTNPAGAVELGEQAPQPAAPVAALGLSFELSARLHLLPAPSGPTRLRFADHVSLGPVGEVELRMEEGPGVRVSGAWQGSRPAAPLPQLLFQHTGPPRSLLSDRAYTVEFSAEPLPVTAHSKRIPKQTALAAGSVVFVIVWVRARRRRRAARL